MSFLGRLWGKPSVEVERKVEPRVAERIEPKPPRIPGEALAWAKMPSKVVRAEEVFRAPDFPPGVAIGGSGGSKLAMDEAAGVSAWGANALSGYSGPLFGATNYAESAMMAQRPEYRKVVELIATEMTRKWIKVQAAGDEDKSERVAQLTAELDRLKVRDIFRTGIEQDGFFGRAHIYLDLGADEDLAELLTPIGNGRDDVSKLKLGVGCLKSIRNIEPMWVYPQGYNTNNPLAPDWYKPQQWSVMGKPVHRSRLLTLVSRDVPDILKPAYQFGGLSLIQMLRDYVENFLRTRQSVSDLIHSFSVSGVKTNLQNLLANPEQLAMRAQFFNEARDNRGLMLLDKDTEEFFNVTTALGTLDHLQAQSQEQIASIASTPLVKLFGIQPTGLNASSDGEIRVWYDWTHAQQENVVADPLDVVFSIVQISLWGEVDPDITYKFEPLWAMSENEIADLRLKEAQTGEVLINAGVIGPVEERIRVAAEEDSPYASLDVDELPEPVEGEEEDLESPEAGREGDGNEEDAAQATPPAVAA